MHRNHHLTHTVLSSLLWCAVVFAFAGMVFTKYETAARALRDSGVESVLSGLQNEIQVELDKGNSLSGVKAVQARLAQIAAENDDITSLVVFQPDNGRIVYGVPPTRTGLAADADVRQKCADVEGFFIVNDADKEKAGSPVFNAFGQKVACLAAEYDAGMVQKTRENMISAAFEISVRLAIFGIIGCFLLFFFSPVSMIPALGKSRSVVIWVTGMLIVVWGVYAGFSKAYPAFEKSLSVRIAAKSRIVAKQVKYGIEQAVQKGQPFKSVNGLEVYLDGVRQKNREIMFILITDKTGRVLYESGTAAKAFSSDARTGRISLRKGYYNAVEPVTGDEGTAGWVQIGVDERFVRETVL